MKLRAHELVQSAACQFYYLEHEEEQGPGHFQLGSMQASRMSNGRRTEHLTRPEKRCLNWGLDHHVQVLQEDLYLDQFVHL